MVWQERVSLIVMLTELVENGKPKSDHYWPYDQQKEEACEGLTIEMVRFKKLRSNRIDLNILPIKIVDKISKNRHHTS